MKTKQLTRRLMGLTILSSLFLSLVCSSCPEEYQATGIPTSFKNETDETIVMFYIFSYDRNTLKQLEPHDLNGDHVIEPDSIYHLGIRYKNMNYDKNYMRSSTHHFLVYKQSVVESHTTKELLNMELIDTIYSYSYNILKSMNFTVVHSDKKEHSGHQPNT